MIYHPSNPDFVAPATRVRFAAGQDVRVPLFQFRQRQAADV
jgi:hypothetical protein